METLWRDYVEKAKSSIPSDRPIGNPISRIEDLFSKKECLSPKEEKSFRMVLGKEATPAHKVADLAIEIGLDRLATILETKDKTEALGKLAILLEKHSSPGTTKETGGSSSC